MSSPMEPPKTFNIDDYAWKDDLKTAIEELKIKRLKVERRWNYYKNNQPRVWVTDTIQELLDERLITNMSDNWIRPAVNAPLKRLKVKGWISADNNSIAVEAAKLLFKDNDLDLSQTDLYRQMRVAGESFIFAWKDENKESLFDLSIVDAREVWWPDSSHRSKPEKVARVWLDASENVWRATLFYPYVTVRLVGAKVGADNGMPEPGYFQVDPTEPGGIHGFDQVPVIRYAMERECESLVDLLIPLQDKINKLSANLMVSAEFNTWRKLIILTTQTIDDGVLKARPDRAIVLDPGNTEEGAPTSIWEGSATELANYDKTIDRLIEKLMTKADMPGHMQVKSDREVPSGAAYEADEGPFTEMIEDMSEQMGASHQDLLAMCLEGAELKAQWRNPHVRSDVDEMTTVKTAVEAGMPLRLALKFYAGWDDDMLKELDEQPLSPTDMKNVAIADALAKGETVDPNTGLPPQEQGTEDATQGGTKQARP